MYLKHEVRDYPMKFGSLEPKPFLASAQSSEVLCKATVLHEVTILLIYLLSSERRLRAAVRCDHHLQIVLWKQTNLKGYASDVFAVHGYIKEALRFGHSHRLIPETNREGRHVQKAALYTNLRARRKLINVRHIL